jgi:hypothetical protein
MTERNFFVASSERPAIAGIIALTIKTGAAGTPSPTCVASTTAATGREPCNRAAASIPFLSYDFA